MAGQAVLHSILSSLALIHLLALSESLSDYVFLSNISLQRNPRGETNHRGAILSQIRRVEIGISTYPCNAQEHPLVAPHVSHFSHVPFRTMVKFWHSEHMLPV